MADEIVINSDRFTLYLSEEQIRAKVKQLSAQINNDYKGRVPIFIGILNGSFIFFSDLIREITVDCEVDFLKLSSYGDAKISSGQVRLLKDLNCQVRGRDIVVVEDIIDSGLSIDFMKKLVMRENPASFRVVTLLLKKTVAKLDFPIDYVGFEIPPEFVIGYGLDYAQKVRNLKAIYKLAPKDPGLASAEPGAARSSGSAE
jgi:hypoxanthine phosphoribosyltransferase